MNDKTYTTDEMLYANKDELNWYKQFLEDNSYLFRNTADKNAISARADLIKRIHLGEQIVKSLEKKLCNECIDTIQDVCEELREDVNDDI